MSKASVEPVYVDALKLSENLSPTPKNLARVGDATSPEAARWAFSQWALRQRAKAKFARADEMLFDRDGIEMATHERLADYHASLFPSGMLVYDLTAGIGADLIAIARRGPTVGLEVDPGRAELARHNLAVHGLTAEIRVESWESLENAEYFYLDPARRSGGRRTLIPEEFEPNPVEVLSHFPGARLGVLKLSPMLHDAFLESLGGRLEFLSFGGECREALVEVGSDAQSGRFAVHVESGESLAATESSATVTEEPAEYVYEADPAAIRAHTLGTVAGDHGLQLLGDSNGYLTGGKTEPSVWLRAFRVLSTSRLDIAALKSELASLGSSTPVLKQKGAGQDLVALRRKLSLKGNTELAVALFPVAKSLRYVVLEPVR